MPRGADAGEAGAASDDGSAEAAPGLQAVPEEPADWTGQGELDLVTEAELAREKKSRSGPPAAGAPATEEASGASPEKDAGADADTGVAGAAEGRTGGEVPAEEPAIEPDAAGAARPPGPSAEEDTAGPREPDPATKDPEPAGGLMRF